MEAVWMQKNFSSTYIAIFYSLLKTTLMPTTLGADVRTIGDIVYILAKCSKEEADAAEKEICKSPKAVAALLTACGLATYSVGAGGRLIVVGAATSGSTVIPGIMIAGAGLFAAQRFCSAAVNRAAESLK